METSVPCPALQQQGPPQMALQGLELQDFEQALELSFAFTATRLSTWAHLRPQGPACS